MAIDRGTRRQNFVHIFETFALLGALGGAGLGIFQQLGNPLPAMLTSALQVGFLGFIAGSVIGLVLGTLVVIVATIFR